LWFFFKTIENCRKHVYKLNFSKKKMFTNWNKGWVDVDVVFFKNIKIQNIYLDIRTKSEKKFWKWGTKVFLVALGTKQVGGK
jgi:hypothetical protein